jgi:hypothetical protein
MERDDADRLNIRAYLALQGGSMDWRRDLAELMRSDVPLSRMLRDRLAAAFENESPTGPRLELKNHKAARDRFAGVATKHQWMEIGRSITALTIANVPVGVATQLIADRAGASEKKCAAALGYYREATAWVQLALQSEAGAVIGPELLEKLHHSIHENPAACAMNAELLSQLRLSH